MTTSTRDDRYCVISLEGEIDLYYSPSARKQILTTLEKGQNILVDLSAVSYIDSSGIATLVEGHQLAKSSHLNFALVGVSSAAMKVLQLARLDKVFKIYDSIEQVET